MEMETARLTGLLKKFLMETYVAGQQRQYFTILAFQHYLKYRHQVPSAPHSQIEAAIITLDGYSEFDRDVWWVPSAALAARQKEAAS